ncbi:MAG: PQQ-binding-like beta-propeller repeat protein [Polyangiales bacterium]
MTHGWMVCIAVACLMAACGTDQEPAPDFGASADWPSFGHDLYNTRSNTLETQIGPDTVGNLRPRWEFVGVETTGTPAVVDGVVYFADWDGVVYARNAADGSEVWTTESIEESITASVLVTDALLFVGDASGAFHALDRATGRVVWSKPLDDHPERDILSSAIAIDDILVVGVASSELVLMKDDYTFRGSVVALSQDDGSERWRFYTTNDDAESGAGVSVWSSAAVDTERKLLFVGTGQAYERPAGPLSDSLLAIDYEEGALRWSRQFTEGDVYTALAPPPQGADADIGAAPNLFSIGNRDVVGVGDKAGVYAVFDRDDGQEIWVTELGPGSHLGGVMTAAAYHDGRIYVANNIWPSFFDPEDFFVPVFEDPENTSELLALDATDGSVLWRMPALSPTLGGISYANGIVYTADSLARLRAHDARNGAVLWSDRVSERMASGQVVSNGLLFVTHGFTFFGTSRPDLPGYVGGLRVYGLP